MESREHRIVNGLFVRSPRQSSTILDMRSSPQCDIFHDTLGTLKRRVDTFSRELHCDFCYQYEFLDCELLLCVCVPICFLKIFSTF